MRGNTINLCIKEPPTHGRVARPGNARHYFAETWPAFSMNEIGCSRYNGISLGRFMQEMRLHEPEKKVLGSVRFT